MKATIDTLGRPPDDPDYYRRQVDRMLRNIPGNLDMQPVNQPTARPTRQPRKPTAAETEYERVYLAEAAFDTCSRVVAQWPARWPTLNGTHTYTPDFSVWRLTATGWILAEIHEVKGGFARATGKQRDSRVLFDAARAEYAWMGAEWVWAEKRDGGGWTVDRYEGQTSEGKDGGR